MGLKSMAASFAAAVAAIGAAIDASAYVDGRQHGQKVGTSEGEFVSRAECFALISTELKGFRSRKVEGPMALEPGSSLDAIVDSGDSFEVDYVRVYDEC